jgi:hypothetical protein
MEKEVNKILERLSMEVISLDEARAEMRILGLFNVSGSLPSVDEAGVMAVKISETLEDKLTAQEQSFFIAGFCECVKWLGSNDR